MFPINWNDIFRKKDGTLGTMEELGGSSLPEYSSSDAGKVLGVNDEGGLEWNDVPSELPEYSSSEAGKVLGVDNDGLLEWKTFASGMKIYSKVFQISFINQFVVAGISSGEVSASRIHIAEFNESYNANDISVAGYTPISAIAVDVYTGYKYGVMIEQSGNSYYATIAIAARSIDNGGLSIRVFYAKNEDLVQLT